MKGKKERRREIKKAGEKGKGEKNEEEKKGSNLRPSTIQPTIYRLRPQSHNHTYHISIANLNFDDLIVAVLAHARSLCQSYIPQFYREQFTGIDDAHSIETKGSNAIEDRGQYDNVPLSGRHHYDQE